MNKHRHKHRRPDPPGVYGLVREADDELKVTSLMIYNYGRCYKRTRTGC